MSSDIEEKIKRVVADLFLGGDDSVPIASDTDLIESGICDSLGLVQLATALEPVFPGLRIHDQDVTHANMGSPRAIAALISRYGTAH